MEESISHKASGYEPTAGVSGKPLVQALIREELWAIIRRFHVVFGRGETS